MPFDIEAWLVLFPPPAAPAGFQNPPAVAAVAQANPGPRLGPPQGVGGHPQDKRDKWAAAALEDEVRKVETAIEGDRNGQLNRSAFAMGRIIAGGSIAQGVVEQALHDAGIKIGLDHAEIAPTLRSGIGRGTQEPREYVPAAPNPGANGNGYHPPTPPAIEGGHPQGEGRPPGFPGPPAPGEEDHRPFFVVTTEYGEMTREAIRILGTHPNIYTRIGYLFEILQDGRPMHGLNRGIDAPKMSMLDVDKIRPVLSDCSRAIHYVMDQTTKEWEEKPCSVPDSVIRAVNKYKRYDGVRPLEWITETPILRPDGTILQQPGYDEMTAVYYAPNCNYMPIPDEPTQEEARAAALRVLTLVGEFPFTNECYKGAWLSTILSVLCRFAFEGPVPVFLYDSAKSRTGKTLLCDLVSMIVTGRIQAKTPYPSSEEEIRKKLFSILLGGDRIVLLDNIPGDVAFGGPTMDAILTGTVWTDRILGVSKTVDIQINTVFMVTGNNLTIKGDLAGRLIPCRIRTPEEEPARRTFRIENLKGYCLEHRAEYVRDVLTIARGYHAAGRPAVTTSKMGGFMEWSDWVRSAVVWALGQEFDPLIGQDIYKRVDPAITQKNGVILGLSQLPGIRDGLTASQILKHLDSDTSGQYDVLHDAVMEWSFNDRLPSAKSLGRRFKGMKDEVVGGMFLTSVPTNDKRTVWRVLDRDEPVPDDEIMETEEAAHSISGESWGASSAPF